MSPLCLTITCRQIQGIPTCEVICSQKSHGETTKKVSDRSYPKFLIFGRRESYPMFRKSSWTGSNIHTQVTSHEFSSSAYTAVQNCRSFSGISYEVNGFFWCLTWLSLLCAVVHVVQNYILCAELMVRQTCSEIQVGGLEGLGLEPFLPAAGAASWVLLHCREAGGWPGGPTWV